MSHVRPISTYLLSSSFRRKLKAVLEAQIAYCLNTDGAHSIELTRLVAQFKPDDEQSWHDFAQASALSFRRFTETAMSLIEIETGNAATIDHHESSKSRIAQFLSGRIARHELYYVGSTRRLRKLAESANARNDLNHVSSVASMPMVVKAQSMSV